ncbi:hypothetical protein BSKO_09616 [Bryopsis sp. KO-2023]|nr:hypothetical protein BSKO_09616 [Bryopsis sp. KO-2023]
MHARGALSRFSSPLVLGRSAPKRGTLQIVHDEKKGGSDSKPFREAHEFLGDMGARDPFAAELESNFGDKVLGNWDTEHLIAPPDEISKFIGLTSRKCKPCEGGNVPVLEESEIDRLRNQVPGWMVVKDGEGSGKIRQEWKVKNFTSGLELFKRIAVIAEDQGHHPDLHLTGFNTVAAELSTHSVGGLTENDFIMAAQINKLDFSDLKKKEKPKFWA